MLSSLALVSALLGVAPALAATPAYYHPDDVAAVSERFAEAAREIGPPFEAADAEASRYGTAMADLELGVALLGKQAPLGLDTWATALRRDVTGQFLVLQKYADAVQGDYSRAFGDAVARALPTVGAGRTVTQCTGSGMLAMMHHTSCEGENLNAALARVIDNDPMLGDDLRNLAARTWPHISAGTQAQTPVALTGVAHTIDLGAVASALITARLEARKDTLEHVLDPLQDGIVAHDAQALAAAEAAKRVYIAALGEDGEVLRAALLASLQRAEKKGGMVSVAMCPNPAALGGCGAEDVTSALIPVFQADKKLVKELEGLGG